MYVFVTEIRFDIFEGFESTKLNQVTINLSLTLASISDHSSVSSSLATCLSEIILVISLMGQRLWNLITDIFLVMCWTRSRLMGISSS